MRRVPWILGSLLLAVAAAWALWPEVAQVPKAVPVAASPAVAAPSPIDGSAEARPELLRTEATVPPGNNRGQQRDPVPNGRSDDAALVHVRGRCITAEDGQPLAECTVTLDARDVVQVVTGGDGVFALHVAGDRYGMRLQIEAKDRVRREGRIGKLDAGQQDDLGDIALLRGFPVTGVVVDAAGKRVAGVLLGVDSSSMGLPHGQHARHWLGALSGPDGAFEFESPLPPGEYRIDAGHLEGPRRGWLDQRAFAPDRRVLLAPDRFQVDAFVGAAPLRLVVQPIPEIRGRVVDEQGAAVAGVMLRTGGGNEAETDEDGSFWLRALQPEGATAQVAVTDSGRCDADAAVREMAWGSQDVQVMLHSGVEVTFEVVDDAGAPVESVEIYCVAVGTPGSHRSVDAEPAGAGRLVVRGVHRGANVVQVIDPFEDLMPGERRTIEVKDGIPPLRFVLVRMAPAQVQVVSELGAAIPGAHVQLVRTAAPPSSGRFEHLRRERLDWWGDGEEQLLVSAADTDAQGLARIAAPPSTRGLMLGVDKDGFAPALVQDPQLAGAPLRVVLAADCALIGVVELGAEPRQLFDLVLRDVQGRVPSNLQLERVRPAPDGSFRFAALVPGDYTLELCRRLECSDDNPFEPEGVPVPDAKVAVHLDAGAEKSVTLRASAPVFGTVRGRLLVSGQLAVGWCVDLVRADTFTRRGSFVTGADGGFVADHLLPGRYHLAVRLPGKSPLEGIAILKEEFEVGPGADFARNFDFTRRRLVLHVRGEGAWPLPPVMDLRIGGWTNIWPHGNDVVLDPAPELPVQFGSVAAELWSQPVTMPQDKLVHEAQVVVPWR